MTSTIAHITRSSYLLSCEKRPELQGFHTRVAYAVEFFERNFNEDGTPRTPTGELLTQKYQDVTLYNIQAIRCTQEK